MFLESMISRHSWLHQYFEETTVPVRDRVAAVSFSASIPENAFILSHNSPIFMRGYLRTSSCFFLCEFQFYIRTFDWPFYLELVMAFVFKPRSLCMLVARTTIQETIKNENGILRSPHNAHSNGKTLIIRAANIWRCAVIKCSRLCFGIWFIRWTSPSLFVSPLQGST